MAATTLTGKLLTALHGDRSECPTIGPMLAGRLDHVGSDH